MEQVLVRGVAHTINNAKITIANLENTSKNIATIFRTISNSNINVDVITQNYISKERITLSFTVAQEDYVNALNISKRLGKNLGAEAVYGNDKVAKVSIIGVGMKSTPGVASRVFECLAQNDVDIDMVSTSDINITCIVSQEDYAKAVRGIHNEFQL